MQYMTHPQHGAMHAYDADEIARLEKAGWKQTKEPTAAEVNALKAGARAAALKKELAQLEEVAATAPEAPKPKIRKAKKAA